MDKLKEITERYNIGYTMAVYGTREGIHKQMREDIHTLIHLVKNNDLLHSVSITLPNKDATICEGYNKAKMQDYENRNVLRHKDQDDYYSGWMDCYDWISKGN